MTNEPGFKFTKFERKGELGLHLTSNQFHVTHDTPLNEYRYYADEEDRQEDILELIDWVERGYWENPTFEVVNGQVDF
ncbi:hypothetical protein MUB24_06060 [Lederbergia sp. NSJ-179]|uniref:hypothetical protein n=1 Tax=Lederbergia sp. NSJ-179 TaxID=2931402 RepID=UPI001FD28C9C|nr:hypothetical protein [Lederbergia sp. NSJ-179]MCJ7840490.1 hypothetical protein [Lederbergia sp. NSJ-179]